MIKSSPPVHRLKDTEKILKIRIPNGNVEPVIQPHGEF